MAGRWQERISADGSERELPHPRLGTEYGAQSKESVHETDGRQVKNLQCFIINLSFPTLPANYNP